MPIYSRRKNKHHIHQKERKPEEVILHSQDEGKRNSAGIFAS